MSKFDEILNSFTPADSLLGERIDKLEDSSGWIKMDCSDTATSDANFSVKSDATNKANFKRVGNIVCFDIRLALTCTSTNAVVRNIINIVPKECVPLVTQAIVCRAAKYVSNDDYKCEPIIIQFNNQSPVTSNGSISLFFFNNTKLTNLNNYTSIIAQGMYYIDAP